MAGSGVSQGAALALDGSTDSWAAFDAALAAAVGRSVDRSVDRSSDEVEIARKDVSATVATLLEQLERLPDELTVEACSQAEHQLAAERLLAVARLAGSSGDPDIDRRRARNTMSTGRHSSGRTINRDARRAAAVAANEQLGDRLADGAITPETIDALAKAADDATGAIPAELVDAVGGLSPDQATRVVQDHLEAAIDADDVERRYAAQQQARRAYRYESPARNGRPSLSGIAFEGPTADVDRLWAEISAIVDAAYQAAGGRDLPAAKHQSSDNRRYDALADALLGTPATGGRGGRPSVVITVEAESLFEAADRPLTATQVGSGPIPASLLEDYVASGSVSILLRRFDGVPLWLGRAKRNASDAQFIALAVRDRGCVLCRAGLDRCQAHHLMPWSSPGKGRTDIDAMALLCQRCHRDLHHRNHTLQVNKTASGTPIWTTRAATPQETPSPKPRRIQRE